MTSAPDPHSYLGKQPPDKAARAGSPPEHTEVRNVSGGRSAQPDPNPLASEPEQTQGNTPSSR